MYWIHGAILAATFAVTVVVNGCRDIFAVYLTCNATAVASVQRWTCYACNTFVYWLYIMFYTVITVVVFLVRTCDVWTLLSVFLNIQCWESYFLKVICYSYKLHVENSNLLQLLCYFFTTVTCYSYKLLKKVTCYFSVTFDTRCLFMFR